MLKKYLTPFYVGEKISNSKSSIPPPPQTSNVHLGGGERNLFDTLVNVIRQQNG